MTSCIDWETIDPFAPFLDGTPDAPPAYWRGQEDCLNSLCKIINDILDGRNKCPGVTNEPWESTRRRILELVKEV
jgi:hypothetical protein